MHENFYGFATNYLADIAAMWLEEQLSFSSVVLPACLHRSDNNPFNPGENFNGKVICQLINYQPTQIKQRKHNLIIQH